MIDPSVSPKCPKGYWSQVAWGQNGSSRSPGSARTGRCNRRDRRDRCHRRDGNHWGHGRDRPAGLVAGRQGPIGPVGPAGKDGKDGADGAGALEGAACTTHVGRAGTVSVSVGNDDVITLTCVKIPTWCEANTPTVGAHMHVTCDNTAQTLTFTCDQFWVDVNDDVVDGCEAGLRPGGREPDVPAAA